MVSGGQGTVPRGSSEVLEEVKAKKPSKKGSHVSRPLEKLTQSADQVSPSMPNTRPHSATSESNARLCSEEARGLVTC